jgi:hypothetical protein
MFYFLLTKSQHYEIKYLEIFKIEKHRTFIISKTLWVKLWSLQIKPNSVREYDFWTDNVIVLSSTGFELINAHPFKYTIYIQLQTLILIFRALDHIHDHIRFIYIGFQWG